MTLRRPALGIRSLMAFALALAAIVLVSGSATARARTHTCAAKARHHAACTHRARRTRRHRRHHRSHKTSHPSSHAVSRAATTTSTPQFFSPTSIWNAPVPAGSPLDPNSAAIVGNLLNQEATEANGINTASYGTPIYTVPAGQPTVHVTLDQGPSQAPMQAAINAVPIPPNAVPAPGTDGYLVVYQPSSNTMWEFWKLQMESNGWHAGWAGRMYNVSTDPGYYRNEVDPLGNTLELPTWGAPASSLPRVGGTMTIAELESGTINHALSLTVHNTCASVWAAPAQRTDGNITGDPTCIPEGAHFILDPNLNLASLHLPHFTLMMAQAAQTYGIIINDRSAGVGFQGEDPAQFIALNGYNPYMGPAHTPGSPGALFDQFPAQLVSAFPWSHLELLPMTLATKPDMTAFTETPPSS